MNNKKCINQILPVYVLCYLNVILNDIKKRKTFIHHVLGLGDLRSVPADVVMCVFMYEPNPHYFFVCVCVAGEPIYFCTLLLSTGINSLPTYIIIVTRFVQTIQISI